MYPTGIALERFVRSVRGSFGRLSHPGDLAYPYVRLVTWERLGLPGTRRMGDAKSHPSGLPHTQPNPHPHSASHATPQSVATGLELEARAPGATSMCRAMVAASSMPPHG